MFRITHTKTERSKFFGSIGHLKNVWFASAYACWRCYREIRNTYASNLKWLTPGDDGWVPSISEKPSPSVGTITYWISKGISKKEYKDLIENGDAKVIETHKISIR